MAAPVNTSADLLAVTGDGSSRSVVENLLRQPSRGPPREKPRTFRVARSPLLDQLQTFLPQFQRSTEQLLSQPSQQLQNLDVENTEDDARVVEMNLLVGQRASRDQRNEGKGVQSSGEDTSDSDSEDDLQARRVRAENLQLSSEAQGSWQNSLIQVVSESFEEERSDGEMTVASSASGERWAAVWPNKSLSVRHPSPWRNYASPPHLNHCIGFPRIVLTNYVNKPLEKHELHNH